MPFGPIVTVPFGVSMTSGDDGSIGSPVAGSTTVSVSFGSEDVSLMSTFPVAGELTSDTISSSVATGAVSTTERVIVAVSSAPDGSVMVYGIWTVPVKSSSGTKVASPLTGSTVNVPAGSPLESRTGTTIGAVGLAGSTATPSTSETVTTWLFGSVSLASRSVVPG